MSNKFLQSNTSISIQSVSNLDTILANKLDVGDTNVDDITGLQDDLDGKLTVITAPLDIDFKSITLTDTLQTPSIKLTDTLLNPVEIITSEPTQQYQITLPANVPVSTSNLRLQPSGQVEYRLPETLQEIYDNGTTRDFGYIENNGNIGQVTIKAGPTWTNNNEQFSIENEVGQTQMSITGNGRLESKSLSIETDSIFGNGSAGINSIGDSYMKNLQTENLTIKNGKSLTIKSNSGSNTVISCPTTTQTVNIQLPTTQASLASLPVISDTLGNLSYNDQELLTTSDVKFNDVTCNDLKIDGAITNTVYQALQSQVADNLTNIGLNDIDIKANLDAILSNDTDIKNNLDAILSNDVDIKANLDAILSNDVDIKTNLDNITALTGDFNTHTHTVSEITDYTTSTETIADSRITIQKAQQNGLASLDSSGKVPLTQIKLNDMNYCGSWNALTNTPSLVSSSGMKGCYYVVSVDGNTNLDGITDWKQKDWAVFNGSIWQKIDNTDQVVSVAGKQGAVTLQASDLTDVTSSGSGQIITSQERQQIIDSTGSLKHKGFWNASTNTPSLSNFVGTFGDCYIVSVAGSTNLSGSSTWLVGDWVYFDTISQWRRLPYQTVSSVNGKVGEVNLQASDLTDVSSAGSGIIITTQERTDINASVTVHSDVSSAGSGIIITGPERTQITTNQTNITNLSGTVSAKTLQDAYNNSPNIVTADLSPITLKTTTNLTSKVLRVENKDNTTTMFSIDGGGYITTKTGLKSEGGLVIRQTMRLDNADNSYVGLQVQQPTETYDIQLPSSKPTTGVRPVCMDSSGVLTTTEQDIRETADVKFNKVVLSGNLEAKSGTISTVNMIVLGETRIQNTNSGNPLHYTCLGSNSGTNYCLNFPDQLPTGLRPLQCDSNGNMTFTNQSLQQNDDVRFNSVFANDFLYRESGCVQTVATGNNIQNILAQGNGGWTFFSNYQKLLFSTSFDINHAVDFENSPATSYWNRIQYTGRTGLAGPIRKFLVSYDIDALHLAPGTQKRSIGFNIVRNSITNTDAVYGSHSRAVGLVGGTSHHFSATTVVDLGPGDYIEVWGANLGGAEDLDIVTFSFRAKSLPNE